MTDPQHSASSADSVEPAAPAAAPAASTEMVRPPTKGILPLLAIIFAGIALVTAVIPLTAGITWIFAIPAIVLAIVALVKKSQPRVLSIVAIIVAPLAWLIAIIVAVVSVAAGIGTALDELDDGPSISVGQPDDADDAAEESDDPAEVGTRDNPAPLGSTIESSEWMVVVNSVSFGATDAVLAANQFNDAPEDGYEYVLINITTTYTGVDADGQSPVFVGVEYVNPDGNTFDTTDVFVVGPDELDRLSTLYTGASATGNITLAIPSANSGQGVIAITPGLLEDKVFVAVS
jgi:hypothetical protein